MHAPSFHCVWLSWLLLAQLHRSQLSYIHTHLLEQYVPSPSIDHRQFGGMAAARRQLSFRCPIRRRRRQSFGLSVVDETQWLPTGRASLSTAAITSRSIASSSKAKQRHLMDTISVTKLALLTWSGSPPYHVAIYVTLTHTSHYSLAVLYLVFFYFCGEVLYLVWA
jgi:hypothetical protein